MTTISGKGPGGPKTEAGKAISSKNAVDHGLYAKFRDFRTEEEKAFHHKCVEDFTGAWLPDGGAEYAMVCLLAWCHQWTLKLNRANDRLWNINLDLMFDLQRQRGEPEDEALAEQDSLLIHDARQKRIDRMRRHVNTEFNKAMKQLRCLQDERRRREKEEREEQMKADKAARDSQTKTKNEEADKSKGINAGPAGEFVSANTETVTESSH